MYRGGCTLGVYRGGAVQTPRSPTLPLTFFQVDHRVYRGGVHSGCTGGVYTRGVQGGVYTRGVQGGGGHPGVQGGGVHSVVHKKIVG